jgi:hypothetical protein
VGLLESGKEQSLEQRGFGTNGPGGPQGAPQGSATELGRYQVAHQRGATRMVEAVELENDEALAEAIFFSEEAKELHNLFPESFTAKGQEERRSSVVEDMLRMAETLSLIACQGLGVCGEGIQGG